MSFDYKKLNGKIVEKFRTRQNFALAMGISNASMSAKLNNKSEWKQYEIDKAISLLNLAQDEVGKYFFTQKVKEL